METRTHDLRMLPSFSTTLDPFGHRLGFLDGWRATPPSAGADSANARSSTNAEEDGTVGKRAPRTEGADEFHAIGEASRARAKHSGNYGHPPSRGTCGTAEALKVGRFLRFCNGGQRF